MPGCTANHPKTTTFLCFLLQRMQGVDTRNDAACKAVAQCQAALSAYLTQVRKQLGGGDKINYVVAASRDRLLEVPDSCKVRDIVCQESGAGHL
eukprot:1156580-Pelagomonas_calceolata.AAC.6